MTWLIPLLKRMALKWLGGYMIKKFLMNWLAPMVLDYLAEKGGSYLDDPETTDDDGYVSDFVKSARALSEYKLKEIMK